ncbi:S49 family peptidase [Roseicella sp. DB1501]|uniref:S49 family peptidase n=1 Tax=Roseicella sp. DB1501 TaxID=2730925 RepID=UPI0014929014|nr:S49 family peptidase [Roseicella sp. DB1501]NOG71517.1 S49 family peptidase [Roseicella sp. DB1501]
MLPSILDRRPRIAHVRLQGAITPRPGFGGGISLATSGPVLDRAFGLKRLSAVFLSINSPGGSAVQSSLVAARIRRLAEEKKVPVIACVEDAAASGGYWIACAADEIVADPASILGSIGVIAAGFGFQDAMERLGVERRLRTAGTEKSFWDPFRPERPEDAARLETLLEDLHGEFAAWVTSRRGSRLRAPPDQLFTGRFWPGRKAVDLGLADRLGDAAEEARRRFGEKARLIPVGGPRPPLLRRLLPGLSAQAMIEALEERAAWARLGL